MIRLSALADEISPDLETQISVLREEGIGYIEVRGVWNTNVLVLTDEQVDELRKQLVDAGLQVSAVASPIGKTPINGPLEADLERISRAIHIAKALGTDKIRIFSYYPAEGEQLPPRAAVIERLQLLTHKAAAAGITLLHENEEDIYGDTIARCLDLMQSVDDPHFRFLFDPANFLQCDQRPYPDAAETLRPWLGYVHVKDVNSDGTLVVAGDGEANRPAILAHLATSDYDGFLSLEPHLAAAGQFSGFSGPERFRAASQAIQKLLREM